MDISKLIMTWLEILQITKVERINDLSKTKSAIKQKYFSITYHIRQKYFSASADFILRNYFFTLQKDRFQEPVFHRVEYVKDVRLSFHRGI